MNAYQLVQILPEVLSHESEESKKSPTKGVKASVAIVWVASSLHARISLRTPPTQTHTHKHKHTYYTTNISVLLSLTDHTMK